MTPLAILLFLVTFVILLALSAYFSGCETAMLSLSPLQIQRIRERRPRVGDRLAAMLARPEILLSTLLVGNTFVNAALASVGFAFVVRCGWVPDRWEEAVSIAAVTLLVLLFGEISPKQFAIRHAETLAPFLVRTLDVAIPLLYPFSWCLQKLLKPFRKTLTPERRSVSDEELVSVVNLGQERGAFDQEEGAMVRGILRLDTLTASDVMTPRVELFGIDLEDPPERQLRLMRAAPFVWLPLWKGGPDAFVDFVDVSAYLLDPKHDLEAARCRCDVAVPENIGLDDLLILLYRRHLPMVLVTDEYGGTAGIVSRGDILELLSLETEDDAHASDEPPDIRANGPNCWILAGDTALEQVNYTLGTHLRAEDADRVSGWVMCHAGRIPRVGETIQADGYRVTVQKMRRRQILTVMLEDLDPESQNRDLPHPPFAARTEEEALP